MIVCARGLGIPDAQFDQLYQEASKIAPTYVEIHLTAAHFTTRQWGGKPGEWEKNLRNAIKDLPKDERDMVYASTIYRMIRRGHEIGNAYREVFKPAHIDPNSVRHGLELLMKKSPEGIYFKSAMAHAAMSYENDPIACRDALKSTGWKIDLRIWQSKAAFDARCREWLERRFKAYNDDIDKDDQGAFSFLAPAALHSS